MNFIGLELFESSSLDTYVGDVHELKGFRGIREKAAALFEGHLGSRVHPDLLEDDCLELDGLSDMLIGK